MSDIIEQAAQILRIHRIECTGVGEVTCACRNPSDWMSPGAYFRHVAEALADAGIIPNEVATGYAVLHETEYGHGVASSVWPTREPAENQLSYCLGMQARGRPGSEGRYFVAEVREVATDE